jgi:threonine dehydratase
MFSAHLAVQYEGMCYRYDHPHIIAGQGTLGLEIADQVSDLDAVVVPVGGGGLIAGVALALKTLYPKTTVIVSTTQLINALYCTNNYCIMYMNRIFSVSVP